MQRIAIAELEVNHVVKHVHETRQPQTPVSIAKAATTNLTNGGDLDQNTAAKLEQRLALEMFPTLPLGKALTAWWATSAGAELQNAIVKRAHVETVTRNPLGNGFESVAKDMCDMDEGEAAPDAETDERNKRLAKLMTTAKALMKLGGYKSLNAAIDAAMRFNTHDVDQAPISP